MCDRLRVWFLHHIICIFDALLTQLLSSASTNLSEWAPECDNAFFWWIRRCLCKPHPCQSRIQLFSDWGGPGPCLGAHIHTCTHMCTYVHTQRITRSHIGKFVGKAANNYDDARAHPRFFPTRCCCIKTLGKTWKSDQRRHRNRSADAFIHACVV